MEVIKEGDSVIFEMASETCKICIVKADSVLMFGKFGKCEGKALIGLPYDTTYEIDRGRISVADRDAILEEFGLEGQGDSLANNQTTIDDTKSQKLTHQEIEQMKKDGSSQEIIKAIVENSSTFEQKTEFAKAKYIKRKAKKPLKASPVNLCKFFYRKSPAKIMDLRYDTLSQMLYHSNAAPSSGPLIVMDDTQGLVVAALLERGCRVFAIHDRPSAHYEVLKCTNGLADSELLTSMPWKNIESPVVLESAVDDSVDAEKLQERMQKRKARYDYLVAARDMLLAGEFSGLVLASQFAHVPVIKKLLPYLGGSANLALIDAFDYLRSSREFINVQLTESWMREYQIPLQGMSGTHPHMTTSAASGYLLTAIRVLNDENVVIDMKFHRSKKQKGNKVEES